MVEKDDIKEIKKMILKLEQKNQRLNLGFYVLLILFTATVIAFAVIDKTNAQTNLTGDSVLRVRGLVVTDENGKERIRIGAPLPDPMLLGKRYKRNGPISGILLMDGEGNERSGYFTSDSPGTVALTLDTVQGQTAMFLANDETGANLQMFDRDNNHSIEFYAVKDSPNIIVSRAGKKIFELPESKDKEKK